METGENYRNPHHAAVFKDWRRLEKRWGALETFWKVSDGKTRLWTSLENCEWKVKNLLENPSTHGNGFSTVVGGKVKKSRWKAGEIQWKRGGMSNRVRPKIGFPHHMEFTFLTISLIRFLKALSTVIRFSTSLIA